MSSLRYLNAILGLGEERKETTVGRLKRKICQFLVTWVDQDGPALK